MPRFASVATLLLTASLSATLPQSAAQAGFATVISGDEGAIDGVIQRSILTEDIFLRLFEAPVDAPYGPRPSAQRFALFELTHDWRMLGEAATIKSSDDLFSLEVKTWINRRSPIPPPVVSQVFDDYVPTPSELGLSNTETVEKTLTDGTVLGIPAGGTRVLAGEGASFEPTYRIRFDEAVDFRFNGSHRFRDESATRTFSLAAIDPVSDARHVIVSDFLGYYSDTYFTYDINIDGETFRWSNSSSAGLDSEVNQRNRALIDAAIENSACLMLTDTGYAGRLPAGEYELQLSSSPAEDLGYYITNASLHFEAIAIPEPGAALAGVILCHLLVQRRRPRRGSPTPALRA